MSNAKTPTTIILDTNTLSGAVDDILDTLGLDRSAKSQLLNRVAARVAGPKHNWGFLTGQDTPVVAQGTDASLINILDSTPAPEFENSRITRAGRLTTIELQTHSPITFLIRWDTEEGRKSYNLSHVNILRIEAGHKSVGADLNAEWAVEQIPASDWARMVAYVKAYVAYAMQHTDAGDTIMDAFFQLCNTQAHMEGSQASDVAAYLTEKFFCEVPESFSVLKDFEYEGARSLYDLIEADYASWVFMAQNEIAHIQMLRDAPDGTE